MNQATEAFSRVKIDALLEDAGWNLTDGVSVLFEHALADGSRADYVLCDRSGRPLAAVEAKRASINPVEAQDQGRHYAEQLGVPFVFLSNGEEVRFLDRETDAHARTIATFHSQDDLERRIAARRNRLDLSSVEIDRRIVDRGYQIACIDALSAEVSLGRRKLLVEMATGTGKTRTAAAFVKRLFEAGIVTRVLFLVDRIALAGQAEDAFGDHLRDYPCHVLRPGRGFDWTKRITIATLQTMITEYRGLSSGYFDLVITDECHRSIYGKWSGVLRHFDGIQLGLTATPCTAEADTLPDPEDGQIGRTRQTELLFLQYMLNHLKDGGRCGVVVPEGVLFGSTGAHRELRRKLVENNRVEAVLSLPGGVFNPYSGVKTSVLVFRKGGATERVMFLHADNDGFKLDANHDTPIDEDDLPGLVSAFRDHEARWTAWSSRDPGTDWTEKWWFAEADAIRAADFNLSAGRYRPQSRTTMDHRDPLEILDELKAIEHEILGEIDDLAAAVREAVER